MNFNSYKGHFIRKCLGQHFLHDKKIISNMVDIINPKLDHIMVEIGPGLGSLTKKIVTNLKYITVIEIDYNLIVKLKKQLILSSKLNILHQNAMLVDFLKLSSEIGKPLRIFGNLPYNISISFIFHMFNYVNIIKDMHFLLQKEVFLRLTAKPNVKYYNRLSIMSQCYFKIVKLLEVPNTSFIPMPKVESVMVKLIPNFPYFLNKEAYKLNKLLKYVFNQRRKILKNSLNKFFNIKELINYGINPNLRAENLSIEQYCYLAKLLFKYH